MSTSDSSLPRAISQAEVDAGIKWLHDLYRLCDSKDVSKVAECFTVDASLHFGDFPTIIGLERIKKLFHYEYGAADVEHKIQDVRVHHDQILAAMVVAYRFRNGTELTSKCFVVWYKAPSDEKATRLDVYGDFQEVFKQLSSIQGPPDF